MRAGSSGPVHPGARGGEDLVLAGWGSTDGVTDPDRRPTRLQTADYRVTRVTATEVFARATGAAKACPFDSGAPFLAVDAGTPRLVATEIGRPVCPQAGEEKTARGDVAATPVRAIVRPLDELEGVEGGGACPRSGPDRARPFRPLAVIVRFGEGHP